MYFLLPKYQGIGNLLNFFVKGPEKVDLKIVLFQSSEKTISNA